MALQRRGRGEQRRVASPRGSVAVSQSSSAAGFTPAERGGFKGARRRAPLLDDHASALRYSFPCPFVVAPCVLSVLCGLCAFLCGLCVERQRCCYVSRFRTRY